MAVATSADSRPLHRPRLVKCYSAYRSEGRGQPVVGSISRPDCGPVSLAQRGRYEYEEVLKMPTFSIVSLSEAREGSASGKRAELLQEYLGYIQRVPAAWERLGCWSQERARRQEPGDPAQAQCGGGNAGEETGRTPLGQDRLLLGVRGASARQAAQEPG